MQQNNHYLNNKEYYFHTYKILKFCHIHYCMLTKYELVKIVTKMLFIEMKPYKNNNKKRVVSRLVQNWSIRNSIDQTNQWFWWFMSD